MSKDEGEIRCIYYHLCKKKHKRNKLETNKIGYLTRGWVGMDWKAGELGEEERDKGGQCRFSECNPLDNCDFYNHVIVHIYFKSKMIKMRNKKQHGLQTEKMKPNAITSYKSPLDMVRHNGFVLLSKGWSYCCPYSGSQYGLFIGWATILVCPGLRNFLGCRTFGAKMRKVPDTPGASWLPCLTCI